MELAWFGHGTVRLLTFGQTLLVDPLRSNARLGTTLQPDSEPRASIVLLTGEKRDQVETETVAKVLEHRGTVIAPRGALKSLVEAKRTDLSYAVAKKGEVFEFGAHVKVRCLPRLDGGDPGVVYVVEGGETVVFLGDSLMDPATWAYHATGVKPAVILFSPVVARRDPAAGQAFRAWVAGFPAASCIPILYHTSDHADPTLRFSQDAIPETLPPGARLELLSNRPLVARDTRRMRRRT
ncbi:MAG: MBL fold metallo-hydrolase [Candidatus Brocadiae bacterium]|nr:MBL fold metallo-hydrolase [Candidatus Brocadiia bacterium]